ncbi:hypothetical protein HF324_19385 [Chitinophaga oryzae]|uniref:Uncharacterized protein n=1 Tax=Chitinophaga oryzae TaxID=2725414 RepID=A0ABX6LIR3_9BACT|nr:hypothetical protein [Chitinophaga oryzae]QJB39903.1 hypothetical protein HF324_19385 [Chitinophaga oryzae]
MTAKEKELQELSSKVMKGMKIALRKLVEKSAANNEELVIGDKDGTVKTVPARELLSSTK